MKMKRYILISFLFLLLIATKIAAQPFNGGISAGLNVSQVEGDGFAGYNKAGLFAAVFVNTMLKDKLGAQLEIRYSQKGSSRKSTPENPVIYRIELQYIELPLSVFTHFFYPFVGESGLSMGYLISGKEVYEFGEAPPESTIAFHKWELAGHVGFRYYFTDHISLKARISYSLARIRPHAGGGTWYLNRGQYNNVIGMGLNYHF
jgi:hypothetical protein